MQSLAADTIIVKTKAPQNRNAVFQYRVPRGYDKNRREMYRVLVLIGSILCMFMVDNMLLCKLFSSEKLDHGWYIIRELQ